MLLTNTEGVKRKEIPATLPPKWVVRNNGKGLGGESSLSLIIKIDNSARVGVSHIHFFFGC